MLELLVASSDPFCSFDLAYSTILVPSRVSLRTRALTRLQILSTNTGASDPKRVWNSTKNQTFPELETVYVQDTRDIVVVRTGMAVVVSNNSNH